jgi:hypothetical protein
MFGKHVSNLFCAYCHDELSPADSRRVAEHLIRCRRCHGEFEEIKYGVALAERLPLVPAPDSLWRGIATLADRIGEQAPPRDRFRFSAYVLRPRFAIAFGVAFLLLVSAAFWLYKAPPSGPSWEVARLEGAPQIGSSRISGKGSLAVGQWLETDNQSRAEINVASIGEVQIDPNTRVRLVETKPTEHRLELAHGRMSARVWAPPRLFFVDTPSAVAEDLGCAYTLEVDDRGGSLLRVTLGWVALQLKDRESVVPAGAACATRPGIGPGTPYFEDASEAFRDALARVDFGTESRVTVNMTPLQIVLDNSRVRDTLTLWNLLARVEDQDRTTVYERMAVLVPPPDGVTRDGVLALNQPMLDAWKEALESKSSDTSLPVIKAWKKFWTKGLGTIHGLEGKK